MVSVIEATEKHLPVIQKIARETWFYTYSELLTTEQSEYMLDMMYSIDSLKEQITHKSHHYLLAKEDESIIGYISYELNYDNTGKTKIHKIYILPEQQGKRVGRLLINKVEGIAKSNGARYLLLNMNKYNKAVHFYYKVGFRIVAEECNDIGNGYFMDDYILEKEI